MIARIQGELEAVTEDRAFVVAAGRSGLVYEILLPAFAVSRLQGSIGEVLSFHTLTFLESMSQGATFIPRLAGFLSNDDKEFFELLITVKGLGYRRGLRAMNMPPARIAAAISDRDLKLLQTMPTIGKKNAESLALDLKDKVDRFLALDQTSPRDRTAPGERPTSSTGSSSLVSGSPASSGRGRDAIEALVSMGENRAEAAELIDRVLAGDNPPQDANGVLQAVYELKANR